MNRRKMVIAEVNVVIVVLTVAFVASGSLAANTPLYTVRMEQASSKMNFLPTERSNFVYTTEEGCNLNCNAVGCCNGAKLLGTDYTCYLTIPCVTCNGGTCSYTCPYTCGNTCDDPTCPDTCPYTCDDYTCNEPTCVGDTCEDPTCGTCVPGGPTCVYNTCTPTRCARCPPH